MALQHLGSNCRPEPAARHSLPQSAGSGGDLLQLQHAGLGETACSLPGQRDCPLSLTGAILMQSLGGMLIQSPESRPAGPTAAVLSKEIDPLADAQALTSRHLSGRSGLSIWVAALAPSSHTCMQMQAE